MSNATIRKARKLLGDHRLTQFIHAAAEGTAAGRSITALQLMSNDLDMGRTLDEVFANNDQHTVSPVLKAEQLSARTFRITCGHEGRQHGDGGTWRTSFRACGKVQRLVPEEHWIC